MKIANEMVEAGARLIAQEHGSTVFDDDHVPYEFTEAERSQYRAEARAVAEAVAPLIAAQALREAALKALAGPGARETALFAGGPLHGTTRAVPDHSPYIVMETPGPPPLDPTEWPEPVRHTYTRRKLWREVDGARYVRVVWLWDRIPAESPWATEQVQDAVMRQWFIDGTRVSA